MRGCRLRAVKGRPQDTSGNNGQEGNYLERRARARAKQASLQVFRLGHEGELRKSLQSLEVGEGKM